MTSARLAEIKKMFTDQRVRPQCALDHSVVAELLNAVASANADIERERPNAPDGVAESPAGPDDSAAAAGGFGFGGP